MRSLIAVTVLCLTSLPAFACVLDSDCETGTMCLDGVCTHGLSSDIDDGMPRRSGRLARPAGTTVIAAQVPVALRGQAQRVSASATEAAEVTRAAAEVGPAAQMLRARHFV